MKKLLNVYKPKGMTPLRVIELVKEKFPEYKNEPIGYAGRLDPLAHGVLLLMVGEETTKQRDTYLHLPKAYEFEAALGVQTDTYDALGLPDVTVGSEKETKKESLETIIQTFIQSKLGKQIQVYPPYSSKAVHGKPLHWWAKENRLSEITIPEREIEIDNFKLREINKISAAKLKTEIMKQIDSVRGDFRQKEIRMKWEKFFAGNKNLTFQTARFTVACSSGTYIRSLVNDLGITLGTGAITLEILRTKVGEYSLNDSLKLA